MDNMRIESKFMTGIVSKIVSMWIKKKFGYNVKLNLNEINTTVDDGQTHLHLDVDADLSKDELNNILEDIGIK